MIRFDDLEEYGYQRYPIPRHREGRYVIAFCQKHITFPDDEEGIYVDAYMYDFSDIGSKIPEIVFEAQFCGEEPGTTFNVSTVGWNNKIETLAQVDEFFTEMYMFSRRFKKLKED